MANRKLELQRAQIKRDFEATAMVLELLEASDPLKPWTTELIRQELGIEGVGLFIITSALKCMGYMSTTQTVWTKGK